MPSTTREYVLDYFEQKPDKTVLVDQLVQELAIDRLKLVHTLKALDAEGHGKFTIGRRGHPSRFELSGEPRQSPAPQALDTLVTAVPDGEDVSAAAARVAPAAPRKRGRPRKAQAAAPQDPVASLPPTIQERRKLPKVSEYAADTRDLSGTEYYYFLMRSNCRLQLELPNDMSREEAAQLAEFIRMIPEKQ